MIPPLHSTDNPRTTSVLAQEIHRITERYAAAYDRAHRLRVHGDLAGAADAEDARRDAEEEYWRVRQDLAELFLLLLRHAIQQEPEALRLHLAAVLPRGEIVELTRDVLAEDLPEALAAIAHDRRQ